MSAAPATIAAEGKKGNPFKFSWQQTMLRIKDPAKSLPFYEEVCWWRDWEISGTQTFAFSFFLRSFFY